MFSGRGIDGELKSKFGELTERFWKSNSWGSTIQAKIFQAIYLTSEGGDGGEGKKLEDLKGDGEKLVTANGDSVNKFFGYCVGSIQNGNDCKGDNNNESVVLVGGDNEFGSDLKENVKSQWSWTSGNGSIVDGGHKYSGIFNQIKMKSGKPPTGGRFNGAKLRQYQKGSVEKNALLNQLCQWVRTRQTDLQEKCKNGNLSESDMKKLTLPEFLNSDYAKDYFGEDVWNKYGRDGSYLALLALMNLWSTDLAQMNFGLSKKIFETDQDKFKLRHLMGSNGEVIYLDADNSGSNLKAISYHSGGDWEVRICSKNSGCYNGEGLNLTMGNGKFCVIDKVCFSESDTSSSIAKGKDGWNKVQEGGTALWTNVFGKTTGTDPSRTMFISLIVACFKDVKNVSLSVQEPSKEGRVIFTQLK